MILEYGTAAAPRFMLIDGGPEAVFDDHLEDELKKIKAAGGKLDLAAISHVDNDHIIGLLDLFTTIRDQRTNH
jgi:glyoxylase-like metal-dependent hydrolase (beta-lactamase superfamily II)